MPDLPVELWSMVISQLHNVHQPHTITHQADLCAIARVNSNANTAASSKLYAHVRVIDFDGLFEGYDYIPSEKRQPKNHWLSTIKSMRAAFSYYDITPRMGLVMTRLLVGHNHYERLAEMMPNLSKLQLVSDLQGAIDNHSTPVRARWSLLSLPAQHICQTPCEKSAFRMDVRPSPKTMLMHEIKDEVRRRDAPPLGKFGFAECIGNTGGEVITFIKRSIYYACHELNKQGYWSEFRTDVETVLLASTTLVRRSNTSPVLFTFRLYGWVDAEHEQCEEQCDCVEKTMKIATGRKYFADFEDGQPPFEVQFGSYKDRPTCPACGERQVEEESGNEADGKEDESSPDL